MSSKLVVIGLGLIGGSLAKAAKLKGIYDEVIGISRSPITLEKALKQGVVDRVVTSIDDIAADLDEGDLVLIAVPTLTVRQIFQQVSGKLKPQVTLTDAASVKGNVVNDAREILGECFPSFVPGHPIAGSEQSGVDAANVTLFENHHVILTPMPETGKHHLARVTRLWEFVGAKVSTMPVIEHDKVLAATSHLPHLLAFSLVDTLAGMQDNLDIFRYAAGGFRDFTRIASSDPLMWRDIFIANQAAVIETLDKLTGNLTLVKEAIGNADSDYMLGVFTRAREARNHFTKMLEHRAYMETQSTNPLDYLVKPAESLQGRARVPGDKSISHRSIMLGAIAEGVTEVNGFLEGEDSLATLQAFRDMGVVIEGPDNGYVKIHGVGVYGLKQPPGPLYLGNSGTSMRLLSGLMAGQNFDVELTGDESLSVRPMKRVADPLRLMGAEIQTAEGGCPPLKIKGGKRLKAINYSLPMASAQVKSCVLLAGLYAEGQTSTLEPAPTRDHTERMLTGFGYPVHREGAKAWLDGGKVLSGCNIDVPADISSAAFFIVGASIAPGSDIVLEHVGINPTRVGVINILQMMGADINLSNISDVGGEPVADIRIRYAPLHGIDIPEDQVPLAIDEFPAIFIAAVAASGTTRLTGAEELRVKESDRIQAMADGLANLGVSTKVTDDGIVIEGGQPLQGGEVDSLGDHRIAMSFAIAGLLAKDSIRIKNCNNVATSFPGFTQLAGKLGLPVAPVEG